jgi:hypothetical protein
LTKTRFQHEKEIAVSATAPPLTGQPAGNAGSVRTPAHNLAVASIGMGIPITAICLGTTEGSPSGIAAMLIAWGGIAAVNFAHSGRR